MFETWNDLDRTFRMMEDLRRRMDTSFPRQPNLPRSLVARLDVARPRAPVVEWNETDDAFFVVAEIPGVAKEDVELSIESDQITLALKRNVETEKDYSPVMEERASWNYRQTFALPTRVDVDRAEAHLELGVLEIRLPKHPEAKPRQIPIRTK